MESQAAEGYPSRTLDEPVTAESTTDLTDSTNVVSVTGDPTLDSTDFSNVTDDVKAWTTHSRDVETKTFTGQTHNVTTATWFPSKEQTTEAAEADDGSWLGEHTDLF